MYPQQALDCKIWKEGISVSGPWLVGNSNKMAREHFEIRMGDARKVSEERNLCVGHPYSASPRERHV